MVGGFDGGEIGPLSTAMVPADSTTREQTRPRRRYPRNCYRAAESGPHRSKSTRTTRARPSGASGFTQTTTGTGGVSTLAAQDEQHALRQRSQRHRTGLRHHAAERRHLRRRDRKARANRRERPSAESRNGRKSYPADDSQSDPLRSTPKQTTPLYVGLLHTGA